MKQIIFLVLEPVALGLRRQRYGRFDQGRRHVCPPAPVSSPNSDPAFEQQECINKAKALFGVVEEAKRFASAAGRGQQLFNAGHILAAANTNGAAFDPDRSGVKLKEMAGITLAVVDVIKSSGPSSGSVGISE